MTIPSPHRVATHSQRANRVCLVLMVAAAATLYTASLSINGYANQFYSAAMQAGAHSWRAWLWGASDWPGVITVDKPPASLWIPSLFIRIFGLNSWSVLLPEALMGVATVYAVYRITLLVTSRWKWSIAAGCALMLVPVATLMFRFNNPDALMLLLQTFAVWGVLSSIKQGKVRGFILAGIALGFAFLTKQLQGLLPVPVLGITYLLFAAKRSWGQRIRDSLLATAAMTLAGGWWVVLSMLVNDRPWIGGSQTNSFLELTFGYNGLGRINGEETGSVGGGQHGGGMGGGTAGILRLFSSELSDQISWFIPAMLIAFSAALLLWFRAKSHILQNDQDTQYQHTLWGAALFLSFGWFAVTAIIFSFMAGIFHAYYTVALSVPVILTLIISTAFVSTQGRVISLATYGACVLALGLTAAFILIQNHMSSIWIASTVACSALSALLFLLLAFSPSLLGNRSANHNWHRLTALSLLTISFFATLVPTAAWSLYTAGSRHTGSIVSASFGASNASNAGGPGKQGGPQSRRNDLLGQGSESGPEIDTPPMLGDGKDNPTGASTVGTSSGRNRPPQAGQPTPPNSSISPERSSIGRLLNGAEVSENVKALLLENSDQYQWVAAAVGSQTAASYQLATDRAVISIGGFNGSDPWPTLDYFKQLVHDGKIHYWISGGGFGGGSGSHASSEIDTWVCQNFKEVTVDGTTLYDLTEATSAQSS